MDRDGIHAGFASVRDYVQKISQQKYWGIYSNIFFVLLSIVLFVLILVNGWFVQLGASFRDHLLITVPIFILAYLTLILPGNLGAGLTLIVISSSLGIILSGLWGSTHNDIYINSGLFPYFDASYYYGDARWLLEGKLLSEFSATRPLFITTFSSLLGITGRNFQAALGIFVGIIAIAIYLSVMEIRITNGPLVAASFFYVCFLFYRFFAGYVMTENLGFLLGLLGFALLWRGSHTRKTKYIFPGILLLVLGLMARAGPFFVLPLLVLWAGYTLSGVRYFTLKSANFWKYTGLAILVIVIGVEINNTIFLLLGPSSGKLFSNFSYTLYGLASGGKGWNQVLRDYPYLDNLKEPETSKEIYKLAFQKMTDYPMGVIQGVYKSWKDFFSISTLSVYGFIGINKNTQSKIEIIGMYFLSVLGFFALFRKRQNSSSKLLILVLIGIFLSTPFIPPVDSYKSRLNAVVIPFIAMLPAIGAGTIGKWILRNKLQLLIPDELVQKPSFYLLGFSILVFALIIVGPLMIKLFSRPTQFTEISCLAGQKAIYVRIEAGSFARVLSDDVVSRTYLPNIRYTDFTEELPFARESVIQEFQNKVKPPIYMNRTIDLKTGKMFWLVVNEKMMPSLKGVLGMCGKVLNPISNNRFYYPDSITLQDVPSGSVP